MSARLKVSSKIFYGIASVFLTIFTWAITTVMADRKRSYAEYSEEEPKLSNAGVAETLNRIKNGEDTSNASEGSDDWTPAMSKSQKRNRAKKKRKLEQRNAQDSLPGSRTEPNGEANGSNKGRQVEKPRDTRPGLQFQAHRLNSSIRLASMQELILYCLADGVAPSWIAVKNHLQVRRAVVLFVPGLEKAMFTGKLKLEASVSELEGQGVSAEDSASKDMKTREEDSEDAARQRNPDNYLPTPLIADQLPAPLKPLVEVFPDIWPVKAPGDDKYSKLHSPLHAMLTSAIPRSKEEKKEKGPKPPNTGQDWKDEPTPIISYLTTADDLKENEYVLHPAQLEDPDEAKEYLAERKTSHTSLEDGWQDTAVKTIEDGAVSDEEALIQKGVLTAGRTVLGLDCEMCMVGEEDYALTRISIVGWDGEVVLDELVKPEKPIINYVTQFSGITKEMMEPVTTTLKDIQKKLLELLDAHTILVGHSLESDLRALQLTHPFIIDTSIIYPHPRGTPMKSSLKWLAQKYLAREIQKGHGTRGHDSIEDAQACLDLVRQKCEKGPAWGTSEASNEPIFKRLARSSQASSATATGTDRGRTGAIVDVGTAKSGFRNMAPYSIGCASDAEVVAGVRRCVCGDLDGRYIPGAGVDFTWARFRALERLRGWANERRSAQPAADHVEPSAEELGAVVADLVGYVKEIKEFLPPCTLFMMYSGTGDPRELGRLQEMQRTYRREINVRKWDQLSVKWTDEEEQALKRACRTARAGCGFMCIT